MRSDSVPSTTEMPFLRLNCECVHCAASPTQQNEGTAATALQGKNPSTICYIILYVYYSSQLLRECASGPMS
jgi:hypothetical protein